MKPNLIILCILYFFIGCNNEDVLLPDMEGNLVGFVFAFDEFENPLDDHSKVSVSALGTQKVYQTLTDVSGRFELKNLPVGTYELHFEKMGFETVKKFGIQHLGGMATILGLSNAQNGYTSNAIFIYQLPTTETTYYTVSVHSITSSFYREIDGINNYFDNET